MLDDESSAAPLYRQIYAAIRRAILCGEFNRGMRLPATRLLAKHLGVARMTVVNAYEQLLAEGYLEGKTGAGTYVAATLPEEMLQIANDSSLRHKALPAREVTTSPDVGSGSLRRLPRRYGCRRMERITLFKTAYLPLMSFRLAFGRAWHRAGFDTRRESCSATAIRLATALCARQSPRI